jgi:hypothetical protein
MADSSGPWTYTYDSVGGITSCTDTGRDAQGRPKATDSGIQAEADEDVTPDVLIGPDQEEPPDPPDRGDP